MKRIRVVVLLVAVVLSLACGGLNLAEVIGAPTTAPRNLAQATTTLATTTSVAATYAPLQRNTPPLTPSPISASPTTNVPATAPPATLVRAIQPTATRPIISIPSGWKPSSDSTGSCQVATPPNWQLGKDFFLALEPATTSPLSGVSGYFPPRGAALWKGNESAPLPDGTRYQVRTSLVIGDKVCSVWRIKTATDFTDAEKTEMAQVGKTLKGVLP